MENLPRDLTKKQKLFCKNYLANGYNATQAAIAAGYSKRSACEIGLENLGKPKIKKYIGECMKEIEDKLGITIEWKAQMLKRCADRCMPEEEERRILPTGMISAIAELNKMQGHYAPTKIDAKLSECDDDVREAREIAIESKKKY